MREIINAKLATSRQDRLTPELIAQMDAEEAAFNRLRDEYGAWCQFGASGSTAANIGRRETGVGRHRR